MTWMERDSDGEGMRTREQAEATGAILGFPAGASFISGAC